MGDTKYRNSPYIKNGSVRFYLNFSTGTRFGKLSFLHLQNKKILYLLENMRELKENQKNFPIFSSIFQKFDISFTWMIN